MSNANPELRRAYNKAYWESHKEILIPKNKTRRIEVLAERKAYGRLYNVAHAETRKAYREKNKERISAYHKEYHLANRERILTRCRDRAEDPVRKEKKAAYSKAYCATHREEIRERNRKYNLAHRDKKRNATREWRAKNPNRQRLERHGITAADYKNLLDAQGGTCAICKTSDWGRWGANIDHDHTTGKVRGILCGDCNRALGLIHDTSGVALAMAKYLDPMLVDYERKWGELIEVTASRTDQAKGGDHAE